MNQDRKFISTSQRKEHNAPQKEILFSIKNSKANEFLLQNDAEMLEFYNRCKIVKMDELCQLADQLSISNDSVVVLRKLTVEQQIIGQKRDQQCEKLRNDYRNSVFAKNRLVIHLRQDENTLICDDIQTSVKDQEYYVLEKVQKQETSHLKSVTLDTKQLERLIYYNPYESDDKDSDDSQRTDNSKFDYPEDEESIDDEQEIYYEDMNRSNQVSEHGSFIEEEHEEPEPPLTHDVVKFLTLHNQFLNDKKKWSSFNYEKDF